MKENRFGLTLIEVVVAMLLLGTLLVVLLVGLSRQAIQIEQASHRLRVMEAAETRLAEWHLRFGFAPVNEEEEFQIEGNVYRWQTRPVENRIDHQFLLGKIVFEIFAADSTIPVLSLELVVPSWETLE
jgi:type II secretory pathway pseudopilin PulG